MSETMTTKPPRDMVAHLRTLAPLRPLTMGDAYAVAERQATTALKLANVCTPHVGLEGYAKLSLKK